MFATGISYSQVQIPSIKSTQIAYFAGVPSDTFFNPERKGVGQHSEFCINTNDGTGYIWNRVLNKWKLANQVKIKKVIQDSLVYIVAAQDSVVKQTIFSDLAPYKEYEATIAQSGTGAPTATIMRNTLGVTPTWGYTSTGIYTLTATGKFTANKTTISINGATIPTSATVISFINGVRTSADVLTFTTKNANITTPAVAVGNDIFNTTIRIRVYK